MKSENLKRIEKIKSLAKERDQLILDEKEIINDLLYNIKIAITQLLFDRADDVLLMRHVLRREGFLPPYQ